MKKKFIYLILIIALINIIAVGTVIYQRWLHPNEIPRSTLRELRFEQVKRELALTSVQIERFEEIRRDFHSRIDSLNQLLEGKNLLLLQEIWKPLPNDTRIDTLLNRISLLQMESQHLVILHFYQFKEVLTLAQWKKFYSIVAERFPSRLKNFGSRQQTQTKKDKQ